MGNEEKALAVPIPVGESGIILKSTGELRQLSESIHRSGMAPASLDSPAKIGVAILTGAEAGLSPMAAVRSIYVVKGAPAWLSKAARALILNSGQLKPGTTIEEGVKHAEGCPASDPQKRCIDGCYGYCKTHRVGDALPREHRFTVADAKRAQLWDKKGRNGAPGPWQLYPDRMLMHRAAGFNFDDCWSDLLMGLTTVEVLRDAPEAAFIKDGDTVATYTDPPGIDPLLARASGEEEEDGAGESQEGDVLDVEAEPTATSEEVEASEEPAPSGPEPEPDDPHGVCQCGAPLSEHEGGKCPPDPQPIPDGMGADVPEPEEVGPVCDLCHKPVKPDTETLWREPGGDRWHCQGCGPWPKAGQ